MIVFNLVLIIASQFDEYSIYQPKYQNRNLTEIYLQISQDEQFRSYIDSGASNSLSKFIDKKIFHLISEELKVEPFKIKRLFAVSLPSLLPTLTSITPIIAAGYIAESLIKLRNSKKGIKYSLDLVNKSILQNLIEVESISPKLWELIFTDNLMVHELSKINASQYAQFIDSFIASHENVNSHQWYQLTQTSAFDLKSGKRPWLKGDFFQLVQNHIRKIDTNAAFNKNLVAATAKGIYFKISNEIRQQHLSQIKAEFLNNQEIIKQKLLIIKDSVKESLNNPKSN